MTKAARGSTEADETRRASSSSRSPSARPRRYHELPVRLERMIHFVPPHVEKIRAKVPT